MATVRKLLALVNWQQFARHWHLWIGNGLKGFGNCELATVLQCIGTCELATVCKELTLLKWLQFARYWYLWIGNGLKGIGTCELTTVCKVLPLMNWQQFARFWHLWIEAVCWQLWVDFSLQNLGTCEVKQLASFGLALALTSFGWAHVYWQQFVMSWHL